MTRSRRNRSRFHRRTGFARSEWLAVSGFVLLVLAIALPLLAHVRNRADITRAYRDMKLLIGASTRFYTEYGIWPVPGTNHREDYVYGVRTGNTPAMNMLRALAGSGNPGDRSNPRRMNFVSVEAGGRDVLRYDAQGNAVDPWGKPFRLVYDADYNRSIDARRDGFGVIPGEDVAVWSTGPDRRAETRDDLTSWSR